MLSQPAGQPARSPVDLESFRPSKRFERGPTNRDRTDRDANTDPPELLRKLMRILRREDQYGLTDPDDAPPVDETRFVATAPVIEPACAAEDNLAHASRHGSRVPRDVVRQQGLCGPAASLDHHTSRHMKSHSHIIASLPEVSETNRTWLTC